MIIKACNRPMARPRSSVSVIARKRIGDEGGVLARASERSQLVKSLALMIEDRATTAPIERSIPPEMITIAAPTAKTP